MLLDIVMSKRGYFLRGLRRLKQGADEYLSKPFTADQLLPVVGRF